MVWRSSRDWRSSGQMRGLCQPLGGALPASPAWHAMPHWGSAARSLIGQTDLLLPWPDGQTGPSWPGSSPHQLRATYPLCGGSPLAGWGSCLPSGAGSWGWQLGGQEMPSSEGRRPGHVSALDDALWSEHSHQHVGSGKTLQRSSRRPGWDQWAPHTPHDPPSGRLLTGSHSLPRWAFLLPPHHLGLLDPPGLQAPVDAPSG